jgi:nitrite reductase/ring-hydroxylating ferredoxin subunit
MRNVKMTKIKIPQTIKLCSLSDIPVDAARGFTVDCDGRAIQLFAVRKEDSIHAYENRCPHVGTPLDWQPDQFLDPDNRLIQCSTHGALFRIEDGLCIYGPCINQSLTPITAEIRDNHVFILVPRYPADS